MGFPPRTSTAGIGIWDRPGIMRLWLTSHFWWIPGALARGKIWSDMMASAGIKANDLDFVLISHGHEDHDGGLAELVNSTQPEGKSPRDL